MAQRTNATRLEKMKKRNQCMEDLRIQATTRLQNDFSAESPQYRQTLKALIIQVSARPP